MIFGTPPIITNGLVLYLDAGSRMSYPGSGTTWNDLSGNRNSGSLVNGPTFSSANQGSVVFDGVDDYVDCGNNSITNVTNNFTFTVTFSSNNINQATQTCFSKAESGAYGLEFNTSLLTSSIGFIGYIAGTYRVVSESINNYTSNRIYHLTVTYDNTNMRLYRDGVQTGITSQTGNITTTTVPLCLGINPGPGSNVFPLNGRIYSFQLYNRALSASEVLQNFNATRTRFGL